MVAVVVAAGEDDVDDAEVEEEAHGIDGDAVAASAVDG